MSMLQQFPSQGEPMLPPHVAAISLYQQPVLVGAPTRTELFASLLGEQTQAVENRSLSEHAAELLSTPSRESCLGMRRESTLRALEQAYVVEDRSTVPPFIERNHLLGVLLAARDPLALTFGEATVRKLTLVEDDEAFVTLFCLVMVPGDLEEARRALNSFDETWWLTRSHEAHGKLNFDFELI